MRTALIRDEIQRLVHQVPFQPFALTVEKGDRIIIEHPENIAFDPGRNGRQGSQDFYVITGNLRMYSTFKAVTTVALLDQGEAA
jgi:hypothetical protein